ncbi:MAG: chromate efflux transporter [Leucobacter sp.]
MKTTEDTAFHAPRSGGSFEVFLVFLRLGLTAFGGPVAHLGYFREAFVTRRRWLTDTAYADLVALCQFLPGPASSQVGMAIGLQRAGLPGLIAAWIGFTLPSAVLLIAVALGIDALGDVSQAGWVLGLKAAAVAVVAHAVLGMTTSLVTDARRATLTAAAAISVLLVPGIFTQVIVIAVAGLIGLIWLDRSNHPSASADRSTATQDPARPERHPGSLAVRVPRWVAVASLASFGALLAGLPLAAAWFGSGTVGLFDIFYRAGALVFGGGHVVLPLLEAETVQTGLVDSGDFLAGYGVAQAVPGPLFTFAGFLGAASNSSPSGVLGGVIALVAIFLPAALLVVGVLPYWERIRGIPRIRRALGGVNAGVVGILGAALYDPVFTAGVTGPGSLAIAIAGFTALTAWRAPAWAVVIVAAALGWALL